jgi:hypothetical protein
VTQSKPTSELPLELCAEYDSAAEWCALRGIKGDWGDPLPPAMAADGALKYINADPEAFQQRVKQFAYAITMTGGWRVGDAGHTVFGPPNGQPAPEMIAQGIKRKSHARLIAAAPDLLEACKIAYGALEDIRTGRNPSAGAFARTALESAIRKATEPQS